MSKTYSLKENQKNKNDNRTLCSLLSCLENSSVSKTKSLHLDWRRLTFTLADAMQKHRRDKNVVHSQALKVSDDGDDT